MVSKSIALYGFVLAVVVLVSVVVYSAGSFPLTIEQSAKSVEKTHAETREAISIGEHGHEEQKQHAHSEETEAILQEDTEELKPTIEIQLVTVLTDEGFAYIGKGGQIDNVKNPVIRAKVGDVVKITIIKEDVDGIEHDFYIDGFNAHVSQHVKKKGDIAEIIFKAEKPGRYSYYCTVPGHREAGMEGLIIVEE